LNASSLLAKEGRELLDLPDADPDLVRLNLQDIAQANRWLGGRRALSVGLHTVLDRTPSGTHLTLLDIGTGSGDLPAFCRSWGARRGIDITTLGLDRIPSAAKMASANGLGTVVGCAGAFPIRPKSVDVVLISQVVHHFHRAAAVDLLRACDSFARRAVVVVELARSTMAKAAFRLAARLMRFEEVTVADGLTSIDRGYTTDSAQALLTEAGIVGNVQQVVPYRLVMTWTLKNGGAVRGP